MSSAEQTLTDRAQLLLKTLVERYIREGQPIGSKALAEDLGRHLSPATIRNVLAELEERGLLQSLHTSSGRVPTAAGYRLFINHLIQVQDLCQSQVQHLQQQLSPEMEMGELLQFTSSILSDITHLTSLVTLPDKDNLILHHIEFLPLSGERVLVVLVFNDREIQNRILYLNKNYSASELQVFANYLNEQFVGMDLKSAQAALNQAFLDDQQQMDQLLKTAVELGSRVLATIDHEADLMIAGHDKLLQLNDQQQNLTAMRELFSAFRQKQDILELLNKCIDSDGVQIFIGKESGYTVLDDYSVISSPYSMDGKVLGALAVIGPTRMPYERVISIVDVTAKLLTATLNQMETAPYHKH